ncbi:hypothetical protein DPMN_068797 [Dreissena polymorpha]|uniref:Uncharacterized protein n=1 Tax=Dreissena polymorpha TaxID=45954 RepID=A0A9D3YXV7_DREPO|nr:hypothetical protein DPMN_068797 [Dreissena polymorpha]
MFFNGLEPLLKTYILTNFELRRDFIGTKFLTKNVASRVFKINILTKFHKDWMKTVTSTVYTNKLLTINILTKFHKDWMKTATSIVYTSFLPLDLTNILTKFQEDWMKTINILTKFHKDLMKTVTSTVYTNKLWTDACTHAHTTDAGHHTFAHQRKNCPPPSSNVIQLTGTIFELNSRIKETNVLSKFHENWAKNVTSTVFTCFHYIHIEKNAPPTDGHVFSPIPTIFKLIRDINKTHVLTNFHDDWPKIPNRKNCHYIQIEKNAPPTGGHVFSPISTIFELVRDINRTNVLTNFYVDWAKFVTSRVLTR